MAFRILGQSLLLFIGIDKDGSFFFVLPNATFQFRKISSEPKTVHLALSIPKIVHSPLHFAELSSLEAWWKREKGIRRYERTAENCPTLRPDISDSICPIFFMVFPWKVGGEYVGNTYSKIAFGFVSKSSNYCDLIALVEMARSKLPFVSVYFKSVLPSPIVNGEVEVFDCVFALSFRQSSARSNLLF